MGGRPQSVPAAFCVMRLLAALVFCLVVVFCLVGAAEAAECENSKDWHFFTKRITGTTITRSEKRDCSWVSWEQHASERRCDTEDAKGVKAHVACPLSCGTCKHSPLPADGPPVHDGGSILKAMEEVVPEDSSW